MNTAKVGPVELVYETIGNPSDPSLLLVMGLTLIQFRFVERRVHYQ